MIKTTEQIEKMRLAGKLASEVLEMVTPLVKPGISTGELDKICHDFIVNEQDAIPANVGYRGCLLYTSPSPRDYAASRMPSSA